MKKLAVLVLAVLAMVSLADLVSAGGKKGRDNEKQVQFQDQGQKQNQLQDQSQKQNTYLNNQVGIDVNNYNAVSSSANSSSSSSADNYNEIKLKGGDQSQSFSFAPVTVDRSRDVNVGTLPLVESHGIGTAAFPMGEYGRHINMFPLEKSIPVIRIIGRDEYATFESVTRKINGDEVFASISARIRPRPVIVRTFSPAERVYFLGEIPQGAVPLGIFSYDSEKDKEWPVLPQELQMFCARDAMELGANIVVPLDQYFRMHFMPEGYEFNLGGILSWLGLGNRSNPIGAAISPHGGVAHQQNQMIGEAGASFALFRMENPEGALVAALPSGPVMSNCDAIRNQIAELENKVRGCTRSCFDNLGYRYRLGNLNIDLALCTSQKGYLGVAIRHFEIAEQNYLHGYDIHQHRAEARQIVDQVYYNWAGCEYILYGPQAAQKFAALKNIERYPTGFIQ